MRNKKICIVGGAGFMGTHLANCLSEENSLTIIDLIPKSKTSFKESKNISYINDYNDLSKGIFELDFDYIFYLAGNSSISDSINNPELDLNKNTNELLKFLQQINFHSSTFVFFSSAACYGEMSDNDYSLNPITPYGISKLSSENYLNFYKEKYNLDILIFRFFSIFGEGSKKQVIYDTTKKLVKNKSEFTVYNPNSRRDFIHIENAIKMMLFVCENRHLSRFCFDIGSGRNRSIMEITNEIINIMDINPKINKKVLDLKGDPIIQSSDISIINNLGYKPDINFQEDLEKTVQWIMKNG